MTLVPTKHKYGTSWIYNSSDPIKLGLGQDLRMCARVNGTKTLAADAVGPMS